MQLPFGEQGNMREGNTETLTAQKGAIELESQEGFVWGYLIAFQRGEVEMVSRIPLVDQQGEWRN